MNKQPHSSRTTTGFTLVELLVVISIISILVALLLPAVQQAREAARRTQCKNNLAELSIGLHSYQQSFNMLPPGVVNPTGPIMNAENGYHMSWLVQLLPQIDQSPLFQKIDFNVSAYAAENHQFRGMFINVTRCPSDIDLTTGDPVVSSSYAGCIGGENVPIDKDNSGLLFLNSSVGYEQIRDGASNTLLLGERTLDDIPLKPDLGWMSGTAATLRNTGVAINADRQSGILNAYAGGFDPNTPHEPPPEELSTGGFSSRHTGGFQSALADGSVRFISENIDPLLFQNLGRREDGQMIGEF
ncbi:MAG: DUF1559 domain-containing protein [Planctomycetaceae bacterium]